MSKDFIFGDYVYFDQINQFNIYSALELKNLFDNSNDGFLLGYIIYCDLKNICNKKDPIAQFCKFKNRKILEQKKIEKRTFFPNIKNAMSFNRYAKKIDQIKNLIKKGEIYQLNLTYNLNLFTNAEPENIFYELLHLQNTPYKSFMEFDKCFIISFSPELFFHFKKNNDFNEIFVKPMKGTAKRSDDEKEDLDLKKGLKNSKNMSENVMIVDLMRNDLNKIGKIIDVKLFDIETHKSLHQMTSSIKAISNKSLFDIFESIFPSGSITGAPKLKVMEKINILEDEKRKIYCGAIGMISNNEAIFNIPIRTLIKYKNDNFYTYGVGSGIVWDSNILDEFNEVKLKAKFLRHLDNNFFLFETCLVEQKVIFLEKFHIERLKKSAKYFGIKLNLVELQLKIKNIIVDSNDKFILKIKLFLNGILEFQKRNFDEIDNLKIKLVQKLTKSDFSFHKTSMREEYNLKDVFDIVFFDEKLRLLEGSRSNIILEINEIFYTPPLELGILDGVMRKKLLLDSKIKEKILHLDDCFKASRIFCINSVRKIVEVSLCKSSIFNFYKK